MPAYRLYHIDGAGRFSAADWIDADSDAEAMEVARADNRSIAAELWQGNRFIGRLDGGPDGRRRPPA